MNTVVVGLELGPNDKNLIAYVKQFNLHNRAKKIDFLHILAESNVPEKVLADYPEVATEMDDNYLQAIMRETSEAQIFGAELDHHTVKGSVLKQILKKSDEAEVNIIILGHKKKADTRHILFKKLARKVNCDALIVPDGAMANFKHILVAIDFSKQSKIALQKALQFASNCEAKVTCLNIYEVPKGYYKTGKSFIEFAEIMKNNAKNDWEKFVADINISKADLETQFVLAEDQDKAELIVEQAKQRNAHMILAGSKGHSDLGSFILGSVAESLVESATDIPVWLSKEKGDYSSFWNDFE